eukprot:TRINITY_DN21304_c0_g1_i1.p1 TRINITY_DN21304_c0_g1~~TRINITY_DN21304_c0_g1_i1.p1  ORF type:complete len:258 (-),score=37.86 TRINITY_DN21304_c0_g1_i1:260-1033(-)
MFDFDELDELDKDEPIQCRRGVAEECNSTPVARSLSASRRPRVLCLHGTASSSAIFQFQLGVLISESKSDLDLLFADGTLHCDASCPIVGSQVQLMRKYFPQGDLLQWALPSEDANGWRTYEGLNAVVESLEHLLRREAPVDAVLGFSQGANFATVVAALATHRLGIPLRCAVHLCPSLPGWTTQLPDLFREKLPLASLVVKALKDTIAVGSDEIASLYAEATIVSHCEGHRPLPGQITEARALAHQIRDFILEKTL